jgi:glycosyltransferase involved in cell wall biosynthesis
LYFASNGNITKYRFIISILAMAEIKKRIVIASVLKPVSDTRMTEKIAASLAQDERLDVHVIGYPSSYFTNKKITLHSFAPFRRMSLQRLTTPARIFRLIRKLSPSILIITTHELLAIALLTKLLSRTKIVYDVQENYYLNILHTDAFSALFKFPIAMYVRVKEMLASRWIDHFFLAEEVYSRQLAFAKKRSTVLANKVTVNHHQISKVANPMSLVFSGTLARSTGVFDAIQLARELHKNDPRIELTIIGFAALEHELSAIRAEISQQPFIRLVGGDTHVDHQIIAEAISGAGAGIIAYEPNPATAGRIPTKLYEYLGLGLPIIFTHIYPEWEHLAIQESHPFQVVNFHNLNILSVIQWLDADKPRGTFSQSVYWKTEEVKLRNAISGL